MARSAEDVVYLQFGAAFHERSKIFERSNGHIRNTLQAFKAGAFAPSSLVNLNGKQPSRLEPVMRQNSLRFEAPSKLPRRYHTVKSVQTIKKSTYLPHSTLF